MPQYSPPFQYTDFLIGEELLYRSLFRRREYANAGLYGMTWNQSDENLLLDMYNRSQVMRASFSIPQAYAKCLPAPPCYWDKTGDNIKLSDYHSVIFQNLVNTSYDLRIYTRIDQPNQSGYNPGILLYDFPNDQIHLTPQAQLSFLYYQFQAASGFQQGDALLRMVENPASPTARTFDYLFNFIP